MKPLKKVDKKKLIRFDDKKLIFIDGHHRIAAMKNLEDEVENAFIKYFRKAVHPPYANICDMLREAFNKGIEFERKRKKS